MGLTARNLLQKFKRWWIERWKPWIEFYVKEKERRGIWYRYGLPAGILLTLMIALVGSMLRLHVVPMQYQTTATIAYIMTITILSAIVVITSMRTMGKKLSLFFLIIAVILVSIAIVAYWLFGRG